MENEKTIREQIEEREGKGTEISEDGAKIVFPGEELASGMDILPGFGTFRDGEKIYSKYTGILRSGERVVSVIPLKGVYMPHIRDYVIAEITSVGFSNWSCSINSPYEAMMSPMDVREYIDRGEDISKFYNTGDLVLAKVTAVTKSKFVNIGTKDPRCRKLIGGFVVNISPSKVPRLIGKEGSMINMIKDRTGCVISVGQNGLVWLRGTHEAVASEAIRLVDEFAHTNGLTDRVSDFLDSRLGRAEAAVVKTVPAAEENFREDSYGQNSNF